MPRIVISLSEQQKELWVEASHAERVTLSEWIRRRCDGALEGWGSPTADPLADIHAAAERAAASRMSQPTRVIELPELPEGQRWEQVPLPKDGVGSRILPAHNADPKDKATQEHGKGAKKSGAAKMCPHRVPVGTYCKRCGK